MRRKNERTNSNSKKETGVQNSKPSKEKTGKRNTNNRQTQTGADDESVAARLNKEHREIVKKERFIRSRMWLSTLISKFFQDMGTIPVNIGNNILVTNNVAITKNHLSALIFISEMSEYTPISWTSDIVQYVKDQTSGVIIDVTMKGQRYYPDLTPQSINSREKTWRETLRNEYMPEEYIRRSARCLYSLDVARTGVPLYKFRVYVIVRAKTGSDLNKGIQAACSYLHSIGAIYRRIQSNLDEHLAYMLMMSDKKPEHLKDLPPMVYSIQTVAESMPSIQGPNDTEGTLMGYDINSGYPYFIDFKKTAAAKNIMIEALSGWGKTFMANYWLYPFYACGFNLALMDIKGNEMSAITEALHGITLSMRNTSTKYINTFRWDIQECFDSDPLTYANERFRISKEKMLIIADMDRNHQSQVESLFEEFLQYVYRNFGVIRDNPNTWSRTEKLNPYVIFDMFESYLSLEIRAKYREVAEKTLERLRIYMSRNGSKSHMFRDAYTYLEVMNTRCLTFDFGILESSSNHDNIMFHLHVMDMLMINDEYVAHKKKNHEWTVCLLEESQIADDWLTEVYKRRITLGRAQNLVNVLLGNSVAALVQNPKSAPIVENMNILCLGSLNKSSRRYMIEEFGLTKIETEFLEDIQTNPERARQFLLINRMEAESTTALLEAKVSLEVSNSNLFKVVDTED